MDKILEKLGFTFDGETWGYKKNLKSGDKLTPLTIAELEIDIREPIYTKGRSIRLITERLRFGEKGLLSSGYPNSAKSGTFPAGIGKEGKDAGDITIIAKEILSLKVSSKGQTGGSGGEGKKGSTGSTGPRGKNGIKAQCYGGGQKGTNGERGGKGGTGGTGGRGGDGGLGGKSGNITIQYFTSHINLDGVALSVIDITGGKGGEKGKKGKGGNGGKGGPGGYKGSGVDCRSRVFDDHWIPGGDRDGDTGETGNTGAEGEYGESGIAGASGKLTLQQFNNEDQFLQTAETDLPSLGLQRIALAEQLFLLNHREEAKALVENILTSKSETQTRIRAALIKEKLICGRNYFNRHITWAPVLLERNENNDSTYSPVNFRRMDEKIKDLRELVRDSQELMNYREKRKWNREQAIAAYNFEYAHLHEETQKLKNDINKFESRIETLKQSIKQYQLHIERLKVRITSLKEQLSRIPEVAEHIDGFIDNIILAGAGIESAINLVTNNIWLGAGKALVGAFAALKKARNNALEVAKFAGELQRQINQTADEIFSIQEKIRDSIQRLQETRSDRIYATERSTRLENTIDELTALRDKQGVEALKRLNILSQEAHKKVRIRTASILDRYMRYVDLRNFETDTRTHKENPPEGKDRAYNASHLNDIALRLKQRMESTRHPQLFKHRFFIDQANHKELFDDIKSNTNANKFINFCITSPDINLSYKNIRIQSLEINLLDIDGKKIEHGAIELKHKGSTTLTDTNEKKLTYLLEEDMWIWTPFSNKTNRFAFRPLQDSWQIKFTSPSIVEKLVSIEFTVLVEIPSQEDKANTLEILSENDDKKVLKNVNGLRKDFFGEFVLHPDDDEIEKAIEVLETCNDLLEEAESLI